MTPKMARNIIEQQSDWNANVVLLARLLSPAVVIETELIRAMRLLAMPGVEAGVEADLYFSPLVMTRDPSSIALLPAVRDALHEELRYHQDQLRMAGDIIRNAHEGMDPAILLEEAATYYALSEDPGAYQSMQRQIGTVVRELTRSSVDPDILRWAARSFDDLPPRARHSDAGKEFKRLIDGHVAGLKQGSVTVLAVRRKRDTVQIGYRVTGRRISLSAPPPEDWQQFRLPGPSPSEETAAVTVEIGWPVANGWKTESLEVIQDGKPVTTTGAQLGLLRFRGDGGDEIRIRPSGPFGELQPRLLILHTAPSYDPNSIRDELHDLDWLFELRHHLAPGSADVVVIHAAKKPADRNRLDFLNRELQNFGLNPWVDRERVTPGGRWPPEIDRAISSCRGAIVLLDSETLQNDYIVRELVMLGERRQSDPGFPLHILVSEDFDKEKASVILLRNIGLSDVQLSRWEDDIAAITSRMAESLRPKRITLSSFDAYLIDFNSPEDLDGYLQSMRSVKSMDNWLYGFLDVAVKRSIPIIVRVDERCGRLPYDRILNTDGVTSDFAENRKLRVVRALQHIQSEWTQNSPLKKKERQLRALLLAIEKDAIEDWLSRTELENEAEQRKICFVIQGFGEKTDFRTGRKLNLDASYAVIKETVEKVDMKCIRADEIQHSGAIDKPTFELLLNADLVIADLSTSNINAAYQLGICHALRRRGTIIVAENQWYISFDIDRNQILTYEHLGPDLGRKEASRFSAELAKAIKVKLSDDNFVDSPIYSLIPQLSPPALLEPDASISEEISAKDINPDISSPSDHKSKSSKFCLVIQGFGEKTDFRTGRKLDLDASYQWIREAVENAGLKCIRADEIQHPQIIYNPMYENLLNADLVIADISTSDVNTAYELGVRHGLRRQSTIIVAENQWDFSLAISRNAIRTYEHLGSDIGRSEAKRFSSELTEAIMAVFDNEDAVDSPLYTYLPELIPPAPAESHPSAEGNKPVK